MSITPEGGWGGLNKTQATQTASDAARSTRFYDQPPKAKNTSSAPWGVLVALIAIFLALYFGRGFVYGFIAGFEWQQEGHPGIPSCDSSIGQSDAKRALEGSPIAKTLNITIVTFANPRTLSISESRVECHATVMLNSSATDSIVYSFSKNSSLPRGQYLVRANLQEDDLNAAP